MPPLQAVAGAVGLPVAVQCVALPWQEELCLRLMKEVETVSREKRAAQPPRSHACRARGEVKGTALQDSSFAIGSAEITARREGGRESHFLTPSLPISTDPVTNRDATQRSGLA